MTAAMSGAIGQKRFCLDCHYEAAFPAGYPSNSCPYCKGDYDKKPTTRDNDAPLTKADRINIVKKQIASMQCNDGSNKPFMQIDLQKLATFLEEFVAIQ